MSSATDELVVAIDSGTSSTKVMAADAAGSVVARASVPIGLSTPHPGWVQQDPWDIAKSCRTAVEALMQRVDGRRVAAVGVSNQRESLLLWDRATGKPVSPVISWQDRRTTEIAHAMNAAGHGARVRQISGLPLDPMFSAVKATWLLDTYDSSRARSRAGELCLGTVDSWLAWALTGQHVTEPGNASRTSLLDLVTGEWSDELLSVFDVPLACLPRITPSATSDLHITSGPLAGRPLSGVLGDSHAALFSHQGWRPATAKVTLGTGSSVMAAVATSADAPGLCRTVAWQLPDTAPTLALEGNILSAGATIVWLAQILGTTPEALAREADQAPVATGLALIPAFDGLGAPWWDPEATGLLSGLSLSTTRADLARAAFDSVVMQVTDLISAFREAGVSVTSLVADGGMTKNARLVQDIADQTATRVSVAPAPEASALGVADMAGIGAGLWTLADLEARPVAHTDFVPEAHPLPARTSAWTEALTKARTHTNGAHHG
jgi:glycerol kinase